jgi:hypothetical protein
VCSLTRLLMAFGLLVAVACGGDEPDDDATAGVNGTVAAGNVASPTATPTVESEPEKPTPNPTTAPAAIEVANEPFSVETSDGAVLRGHIYSPDGPMRQALIIAAPAEQSQWAESTQAFTSQGIAVFTFDMRGFGETGGEEDPDALADDIQLVMLFAKSREYPLVYVMAVGPEASEAALAKAAQGEELSGLVTYGFQGSGGAANQLMLAPGAAWSGQNMFEDEALTQQVVGFVLGD